MPKDINDEEFNNLPLYDSVEETFVASKKDQENWVYKVRSFVGVSKAYADNRAFKMDVASSVQ